MNDAIDYKRLYELSIVEKEKLRTDNHTYLERTEILTKELNECKIKNYTKNTMRYQKRYKENRF